MGQMAEDLIDGLACSTCGIYFEGEHGYPVQCAGCYEDGDETPLATIPEL